MQIVLIAVENVCCTECSINGRLPARDTLSPMMLTSLFLYVYVIIGLRLRLIAGWMSHPNSMVEGGANKQRDICVRDDLGGKLRQRVDNINGKLIIRIWSNGVL